MKKEFEAGFLGINEKTIKTKLKNLGAKKILPKRLMRRYIFESPAMKKSRHWLRLRDEGDCITLTLKKVVDHTKIGGKEETEIIVDDFENTAKILAGLGFEPVNYQESYRETWKLGKVLFEFDA